MIKSGENYNEVLKENLKQLRKKNSLTQSGLCEELKKYGCFIDRTTYAKYESGKRRISIEVLIALSAYYNVGTDCILGLCAVTDV